MRTTPKIIISVSCAALPALLYAYASGPDPRNTGAPGDQTCVQCHLGTPLNGGGGNVQISSSAGNTYTPGQQQTFTISITDSKARAYGFQMTARLDSNPRNGQAGDFTAGAQQIVICDNARLKGSSGCPSSAPVEFIEHSRPFTSNTINVTWTAPSSNVGTVTVYVAANAANGNGSESGDHIYTASLQLSPASSTSNKPAISQGGVVAASAFNAGAGIAAGSWLEIYGTNLATTTRAWTGADFNGSNAPTSLDGVSVTIGGIPAYVDFVSPGQVDVQAPEGIPVGPGVPVVVTNSQGQSDPYSITVSDVAPALLAPPAFQVNGTQYAVATFPAADASSGVTYVGPVGFINGVNSRPARPGDVITLYGIGFGPVTPATPAGTIASQATNLSNSFTIMFGQTPATVLYSGLAPGFVGLYQFNIQVPSVSPGDWPLSVQVGGTTLSQKVTITTGQ